MTTINQAIKQERTIRLTAFSIIIVSFLAVLSLNREIFVSFILAFVFTYLISPLVTYLERMGLSRGAAIGIPYFIIFVGLFIAGYIFTPVLADQLTGLQINMESYIEGIKGLLSKWEGALNKVFQNIYTFQFGSQMEKNLETNLNQFVLGLPNVISTLLTTLLLAPILSFFMLQDGRKVRKKLLSYVPNSFFETSLNLTYQINEQLGDFIRAKMIESFIVGLIVWFGLTWIGFPYTIFLAVFAGGTNLIPYVGPIAGAVPAFLLAAINPELNGLIVFVAMIYLTGQLVDILFVIPFVVARTVNLHPVTVLLAIILGAKIMGVLGMLVAIPVASIIKLVFSTLFDHLLHFRT